MLPRSAPCVMCMAVGRVVRTNLGKTPCGMWYAVYAACPHVRAPALVCMHSVERPRLKGSGPHAPVARVERMLVQAAAQVPRCNYQLSLRACAKELWKAGRSTGGEQARLQIPPFHATMTIGRGLANDTRRGVWTNLAMNTAAARFPKFRKILAAFRAAPHAPSPGLGVGAEHRRL
jgi:hypothetical protein